MHRSVLKIRARSNGTGFLVAPDLIVTALHVVGTAREDQELFIQVESIGTKKITARIVEADPELDIAVLRVPEGALKSLAPLRLSDRLPSKGIDIEVLGFPEVSGGKLVTLNARLSGSPAQRVFKDGKAVLSQQLSLANQFDISGMSGSPVMLDDAVIGVVRSQIEDEEDGATGVAFCTLMSTFLSSRPAFRNQIILTAQPQKRKQVLDILDDLGYDTEEDASFFGAVVPILCTHRTSLDKRPIVVGYALEHRLILKNLLSSPASIIFIRTRPEEVIDDLPQEAVLDFAELSRKIVDFSRYIRSIIEEYEHSSYYLSEEGSLRKPPIFESLAACDLYKHYVEADWLCVPTGADGNEEQQHQEVSTFTMDWLNDPSRHRMLVLGEYGVGRTSLCINIAYKLAKRHQEDPVTQPIPLFIPLKKFRGQRDFKEVLLTIVDSYRISFQSYHAFERYLYSGRVLLILDGLDELFEFDEEEDREKLLIRLFNLFPPGSKMLISCESTLFLPFEQWSKSLGRFARPVGFIGAPRSDLEIIRLLPFAEPQVLRIIKTYHYDSWEFAWIKIRRVYDLADLVKKAYLLSLVVGIMPRLIDNSAEVLSAEIYRDIITSLLERGQWRSILSVQQKIEVSEALAIRMWSQSTDCFPDEMVSEVLSSPSGEMDGRRVHHLKRDVLGSGLFIYVPNKGYAFSHRSFGEYFTASVLAREIREGEHRYLKASIPSFGILHFLGQMVGDTSILRSIIISTKGKSFEEVGFLGSTAATLAINLDYSILKDAELSGCCLHGADLTGADLTGAKLSSADLSESRLYNVQLSYADLRQCILEDVECLDMSSCHAVAFSPDGQSIASGGVGGTLAVWDAATLRNKIVLVGSSRASVLGASWRSDGELLAAVREDGAVDIWRFRERKLLHSLPSSLSPWYSVSWQRQGTQVAIAGEEGLVQIWDSNSWSMVWSGSMCQGGLLSIEWSIDDKYLAIGGIDRIIYVIDAGTRRIIAKLGRHHDYVRAVRWSPDRKWLASASDDGKVLFWDIGSWTRFRSWAGKVAALSLAWHPSGELVACGMRDDSIKFLGGMDFSEIFDVKEHIGRVWDLAWDPQGTLLASAGNEGAVKLWYAPSKLSEIDDKGANRFGRCLNTLKMQFACAGALIRGARGLDSEGYQIARNKDRPWDTRDGNLGDWLIARGAILDEV